MTPFNFDTEQESQRQLKRLSGDAAAQKVLVTNMETLLEEALNDLSDGSVPDAWTPGELGSMMMDAADKIEKALELLAEVGQKLDNA